VRWENSSGVIETIHTTPDPNDANSDDDDFEDGDEYELGTDASNEDTDGDQLDDAEEVVGYTSPLDGNFYTTDPLKWDTDGDTLSDYDEAFVYGTNPNDTDTDNDGIPDDIEVANGSCASTPPRLRINDVTAVEPAEHQGGNPANARNSATMTFTVTLECGVVGQAVSASWATVPNSVDGTLNTTAIVSEDFVTGGGSVSLTATAANPGPTTTLSLTILGDQKKTGQDDLTVPNGEDDGTQGCGTPLYVVLRLYNQSPASVQLYDAYGLATIRNDGC
jgi:hypothetical protein